MRLFCTCLVAITLSLTGLYGCASEEISRPTEPIDPTDLEEAVNPPANVIDSLSDANADEGWSGNASGNGTRTVEPISSFVLTSKLRVRYREKDHLYVMNFQQAFFAFERKLLSKSHSESVLNIFTLTDLTDLESQVSHEQSAAKRIYLRAQIGTGPRFRYWDSKETQFHLGTGLMNEYEKLTKSTKLADSGRQERTNRAVIYVDYGRQIFGNSFGLKFSWIPNIAEYRDRRLVWAPAIQIPLSKKTSLKVSGSLQHDSTPPLTVDKLTSKAQTELAINF